MFCDVEKNIKKKHKNVSASNLGKLSDTYLEVGDREFIVGTKATFGGIIESVPCLLARFLTRGAD